MSSVRELVSIIEDRNDTLRDEREYSKSLYDKLDFIMKNFVEGEDGYFTFPDGDTWQCKEKTPIIKTENPR